MLPDVQRVCYTFFCEHLLNVKSGVDSLFPYKLTALWHHHDKPLFQNPMQDLFSPINYKIHVSNGISFPIARFKNISPRESRALPAFQGIVYISPLMYMLFRRLASNLDFIAFFPPPLWRTWKCDSKNTNKKEQKEILLFTHSYVRKSDFPVWFLRYFWTKHPIKVMLVGFVTVVHNIFYSPPHVFTK